MTGETLATNRRMLALARKAGFTLEPSPDVAGLFLLEKLVGPASPGRTCSDLQIELAA